MQFLYIKDAGHERMRIEDDTFHYLYKVRRARAKDFVFLRNLEDSNLYKYKVENITRNYADVSLVGFEECSILPSRFLHLLWAVVDSKVIEKNLPMLNELGVGKISFFYSHFSQRDIRLDLVRFERILHHSCEQSGRSKIPEIEVLSSLDEVLEMYSDFGVMDFGGGVLKSGACEAIMIGAEGGFSDEEREMLRAKPKYSSGESIILRSESAAVFALSRLM
ncbi:MAG: 16S rRNA (uracil(1498)-N(3))-methyltransferase [Wolinella sp.]